IEKRDLRKYAEQLLQLPAGDEHQLASAFLQAAQSIQDVGRHDAVMGDGSVVVERDGGIAHGTVYPAAGQYGVSKDDDNSAYIGVDVGGTKSLFALFDQGFEVLAQEKFRTH